LTLAEMSARINALTKEKNNLQAQLNDSQADRLGLEKIMQGRVDDYVKKFDEQKDRADKAVTDLDEGLKTKQQTIEELNKRLNDERLQHETERDRLTKEVEKHKKDLAALTAANNKLQDELQNVVQYSFEVPDGEVRWVDHASNLVWINLGDADGLPKKTSFSVYTKAHHGVARGNEDVKGAIEVTRSLGPHLSEARILRPDNHRPISVGDPIYSPLWSAGKIEYFALLGKIDFDGDGRDDRARLHELIDAAGAKIESEVDDMGILKGPGVTVRTRFLVVGDIPDPLKVELRPEEVDASNKMMELHKELTSQARQQGVRVVSMNDFLNYIGYTSTRRMWAPHEKRPYSIRSQQPPLAIDETVPERFHATRKPGETGHGARLLNQDNKGTKSNSSQADKEE
jgi:hypothetical protein